MPQLLKTDTKFKCVSGVWSEEQQPSCTVKRHEEIWTPLVVVKARGISFLGFVPLESFLYKLGSFATKFNFKRARCLHPVIFLFKTREYRWRSWVVFYAFRTGLWSLVFPHDSAVQDVTPIYLREDGEQTVHIECECDDFPTVCLAIKEKGFSYLAPDAALGKNSHSLTCWSTNSQIRLSPENHGTACDCRLIFTFIFLDGVIESGLPQKALRDTQVCSSLWSPDWHRIREVARPWIRVRILQSSLRPLRMLSLQSTIPWDLRSLESILFVFAFILICWVFLWFVCLCQKFDQGVQNTDSHVSPEPSPPSPQWLLQAHTPPSLQGVWRLHLENKSGSVPCMEVIYIRKISIPFLIPLGNSSLLSEIPERLLITELHHWQQWMIGSRMAMWHQQGQRFLCYGDQRALSSEGRKGCKSYTPLDSLEPVSLEACPPWHLPGTRVHHPHPPFA
jgi:hypothetical protein